ncbi:MAG TPA: ectonucleotide pyrophosphatase/phosphodiesterase [Thermoanaerobaculia bacterium]|nr:ectonucleotide pyrophosphatase/phosphodiesterase [Thermoanaerobaculia bacterium]
MTAPARVRWTEVRLPRLLLASLWLAVSWSAGARAQERPADHVVLISIDGLRPEFYRDPSWPAPTLQQMAREGVHAEGVRGVFPTVTYPTHTTLITGALPARHGVYYNTPFEPAGQTGRWYWDEAAIQVPTLWDAVRAAGLASAAISWPVTVGAPIDRVLPEVWSLDPDAVPLAAMREASRPPGIWEELEREATGRLTARNFSADWMNRDDTTGAAAAYLLETHRPALLAIHLLSNDHFEHQAGREAPVVRRAVGAVDRAIGAVRDAAERAGILERTAFVVTGDHGFVNTSVAVAPNVWLAEAGLMEARPDRGRWRASFHGQGGATFLHLRDGEDRAALAAVRAALERAPHHVARLYRLVERAELDAIGADPRVPLALAGARDVRFHDDAEGPVVRPASGGAHGYFPTDFPEILTGFVGWGAGLRSGVTVHRMGSEDVAPLVALLLDLDFEAPDGRAPLGVLQSAR